MHDRSNIRCIGSIELTVSSIVNLALLSRFNDRDPTLTKLNYSVGDRITSLEIGCRFISVGKAAGERESIAYIDRSNSS